MLGVLVFFLVVSASGEERTVFGKLKSGFQLAGKLLGIDHANGVAQLVTEAFGKAQKKGDGSEGTSNIFSGFLRVLGFDPKKIGAIAVNAIIFVAQLISSSLSRPSVPQLTEARATREGSPLDWMMGSPEVIRMFSHIKDKELPNHIVMYIKERSLDEDSDCVQLLVCKSAPFVWGMQKVLDGNTNSSVKGTKSLYAYLPSLEEVIDYADDCDKKHPYCFIHI
ncbi:hypothetical protein TcasGA2_TC007112 [Tribolium castaneum]|uniref:Uncharacterized protein n=1 Tax=Tribolium castaneum TaxID=7070 RepID=D2A1C2_TRICA|nr:PREDICTED: uncharacterized protein LOC664245 [Tribolium castaneum]EFA01551.1 hypothetical protein TcasGA2_TC007112 [Tribolium castaneum]|eukprot:XP_975349.1 PREDICTED: uncharacterized protein LOC664245 [Tribolium castaneum]